MKKIIVLLLVAVATLGPAFTNSALAQKNKTAAIGNGETITISTLPPGISSQGVNWPSWVKTPQDMLQFLVQNQIDLTKKVDDLKKQVTHYENKNDKKLAAMQKELNGHEAELKLLENKTDSLGSKLGYTVLDLDNMKTSMANSWTKMCNVMAHKDTLINNAFARQDSINTTHDNQLDLLYETDKQIIAFGRFPDRYRRQYNRHLKDQQKKVSANANVADTSNAPVPDYWNQKRFNKKSTAGNTPYFQPGTTPRVPVLSCSACILKEDLTKSWAVVTGNK